MIYDLIASVLLFVLRWTIIPFIPKARERVAYEKQARHFKGVRSFREDGEKAHIAFEFSSEGELQQCLPLIEASLLEGKKIELIYFSPSVEKGVKALYEKYPSQIRVMNFPLLTFAPLIQSSLRRWMTAKKLILVRYDFLPEILLWARAPEHELVLIWASFKRKRLKNQMLSGYQLLFLRASKVVIAATQDDETYLKKHGIHVTSVFDFRIMQILKRLEKREETLREKFPEWEKFFAFLGEFSADEKLLLGNAWPVDLELTEGIEKKLFLIVPHLVGAEHVNVWKEKLKEQDLLSYEIHAGTSITELISLYKKNPAPIVIHLKGVLCELYHYFDYSYVGGGHGVSVHSLLEPYVSGSQFIACGPKVERSTEFDLSNQDFPVVSIVKNSSEFRAWMALKTGDNLSARQKKLENLQSSFDHLRKRLLHA